MNSLVLIVISLLGEVQNEGGIDNNCLSMMGAAGLIQVEKPSAGLNAGLTSGVWSRMAWASRALSMRVP